MENHEHFMLLAIDTAKEGINKGQTPFGCCIVKNGEVISIGHNIVWETTDITAHAEINTIRKACTALSSIDLTGTVIYSTCEPCPMCFSAIHWAKIDAIYYGASIDDAKNAGFNELLVSNEELKSIGKTDIKINKGMLKDECIELFRLWKAKVNKPY